MHRQDLIDQFENYQTEFNEELTFIPRFLSLLKLENCYERSLLAGHITASAWITNQSLTQVLLMHHKKLNRWLQPGGHADGDEDVIYVAKKELQEETGLQEFSLPRNQIFDVDIHIIPERKGVPEHEHYDIRFHFIAEDQDKIERNNESIDLKWVPTEKVLDLVNNEQSFVRMLQKTDFLNRKLDR